MRNWSQLQKIRSCDLTGIVDIPYFRISEADEKGKECGWHFLEGKRRAKQSSAKKYDTTTKLKR